MEDRFKFRVWSDKQHKYLNADDIWEMTNGTVEDALCLLAEINQSINKKDENLVEDNKLVFEQCTGVKGKNGKLIYEGDILKWGFGNVLVQWCYDDVASYAGLGGVDKYTEIVGNVHENPELLEGKTNDD